MFVITGAAGFIASNLVAKLNLLGNSDLVLVDDLKSDQKWKNLRGLKFDRVIGIDEFISGGHIDLIKEAHGIYHIGACSSTTEEDMDFLLKNNLEYSQYLFSLASQFNIPICYASSAATYGDGEFGYDDQHELIDQLRPLNKYGYSKQLMDQWVLNRRDTPKHWYGLKYFNVFGPNEYHKGEMSSVVFKAFHQIKKTGKVRLFKSYRDGFADGEQKRDFVYVQDIVDGMISLMSEKAASGIYNMGLGQAHTFKQLVQGVFKALDCPESIEYIDMPENIRDQYQYFTEAKMDKFQKTLPSFKFHTFENCISHYVKCFLAQKNPYLDLNKKDLWI